MKKTKKDKKEVLTKEQKEDGVYQVVQIVFEKWQFKDKTIIFANKMPNDENIPQIISSNESLHGKAKLIESRIVEIERKHCK